MSYSRKMKYIDVLDIFMLLILLFISIFNGFMISAFSQLNISWVYLALFFFAGSLTLIFVLIYSSRVYIFRSIPNERIYGIREALWNIFLFITFITLGITYLHFNQNIDPFIPFSILVPIFIVFYLIIYLALSKPAPSKQDKIIIMIFIKIAYILTWLYIIITIFNILAVVPSISRIIMGNISHEILITEKIIIDIAANTFTPYALLLASITITIIEISNSIRE